MELIRRTSIWTAAAVLLITGAVACGGKSGGPPDAGQRTTPLPTRQSPQPEVTATAKPAQLDLVILAPVDGAQLHAGAVRVVGMAPPDAVVAVNGEPAEIQADGAFSIDLLLDDDVMAIEVTATELSGAATTAHLAVFNVSDIGGLPLDVLYPQDGLQISLPSIEVIGVTSVDAVVAVNGKTVTMNSLGIFTLPVDLVEGPNLIEITATNTGGDVESSAVAVFYAP
jgi:hypothetical protein